jgi:hypothetical protein
VKPCNQCGRVLPNEAYSVDKTREDGLAIICLECNREKCRRWYAANQAHKKAEAVRYREEHGCAPPTERGRRGIETRARLARQTAEEDASELHLVRFTAAEWEFCLLQGGRLGIKQEVAAARAGRAG